MRTIHVDKTEFLERVGENRDNHRAVFEEALDGYRRRVERELRQRLHDLSRGRRIEQHIRLPEPEDHTGDYERILAMAVMSISDTVELSESEFAMYVMDQWSWKQDFTDTTLRYLRK